MNGSENNLCTLLNKSRSLSHVSQYVQCMRGSFNPQWLASEGVPSVFDFDPHSHYLSAGWSIIILRISVSKERTRSYEKYQRRIIANLSCNLNDAMSLRDYHSIW